MRHIVDGPNVPKAPTVLSARVVLLTSTDWHGVDTATP